MVAYLAFSHINQTTADLFENNPAKTSATSIKGHVISVYNRKHYDKKRNYLSGFSDFTTMLFKVITSSF